MANLPPRTVALIGAVCLTVGWLLASTLTPPVARLQTLPQRQAAPTAATQGAFTERLHFRLQQPPEPPTPRRNPFVFGSRAPRAVVSAATSEKAAVTPETTAIPVAVGPAFSLAGIAISGETRTAILSDGQDVHIVKPGERVGGYEVLDVSDTTATLVDASGTRYVLKLR